eukprot:4597539-Amphidinium_carterae.1
MVAAVGSLQPANQIWQDLVDNLVVGDSGKCKRPCMGFSAAYHKRRLLAALVQLVAAWLTT